MSKRSPTTTAAATTVVGNKTMLKIQTKPMPMPHDTVTAWLVEGGGRPHAVQVQPPPPRPLKASPQPAHSASASIPIPSSSSQAYPKLQFVQYPFINRNSQSQSQSQGVVSAPHAQEVESPVPAPMLTAEDKRQAQPQPQQASAASASASASASAVPPPPNALESLFQEAAQKLMSIEACSRQTLLYYQQERRKWRNHCLTFKQERDVARRQVVGLMQERAVLLAQQQQQQRKESLDSENEKDKARSQSPESPASVSSSSGEQRKIARSSRRHAPYAFAERRSQSPTLNSLGDSDVPPDSGSESVASVRGVEGGVKKRAASAPPVLGHSLRIARSVSELTVRMGTPPPVRSLRQPSVDSVDGEVEMEMESEDGDEDVGERTSVVVSRLRVSTSPSPLLLPLSSAPPSRTLQLRPEHAELIYIPAQGRLWCRLCLLRRSQAGVTHLVAKPEPGSTSDFCTFELGASWDELKAHVEARHPGDCADFAVMR
ncbi:hypothetical protein FA15DRAFT_499595 [Coprinopsis marcescibilis]|uniref:Uncharacterized protein n=1 Tax=Coprinopsis marcescibilis TaxID=230819 RepID=A0A5C3KQU9_COPMA|nr:hypothetical protein FA15DRAFT_499595 [Coprinopsis marcescibilis]